jgi:hypothetical protein
MSINSILRVNLRKDMMMMGSDAVISRIWRFDLCRPEDAETVLRGRFLELFIAGPLLFDYIIFAINFCIPVSHSLDSHLIP